MQEDRCGDGLTVCATAPALMSVVCASEFAEAFPCSVARLTYLQLQQFPGVKVAMESCLKRPAWEPSPQSEHLLIQCRISNLIMTGTRNIYKITPTHCYS